MSVRPRSGSGKAAPAERTRPAAVDALTASEWAAWWSIPWPARVYNAVIVGVAVAVLVLSRVQTADLALFAGLVAAGMANVELGRRAEGGRVRLQRIHKGLSAWPFAAAVLVGPGAAAGVAVAVYTHALVRGISITRWKWVGSWGIVTCASLAASVAMHVVTGDLLPRTGSTLALAGLTSALVAFLAVEAALLFVISRLNSPESEVYLRAMLADLEFYAVEASVLASGAVAAVLYRYSPGVLLLAGPAYLLMQRGMLHQPLRHEARHDAKTGILHFEAWRGASAATLDQARRDRRRAAVLLVDIDHFKAVNDRFGHLVGDQVLTGAAGAVVTSIRGTDIAGRFGGDELCALLLCETLGEAAAAAERIRSCIASLGFGPADLAVTASIGVALAPVGAGGDDLPALIGAADEALYESKRAGRDQVSARVCRTGVPAPAGPRRQSGAG